MADYALVKERMVQLGEELHDLGYAGPQEIIEGHGAVGRAVADCRTPQDAKMLALYLKDLHQTFATRNPDPEGNKASAVASCRACWADVRNALSDNPDDDDDSTLDRDTRNQPTAQRPVPRPVPNAARAGPTIATRPGMPSIRPGMPTPQRR